MIAVAPYMGAWIETYSLVTELEENLVAPYMGAWIETRNISAQVYQMQSRSLYGSVD